MTARPGFFSRERIVAAPDFNRWRIPPASIAVHLCIGAAYAWSIFNPALIRVRGVVVAAADDWSLSQVVWVFTTAIVCLGLSASVAGKWLERVGPRTVGIVSALLWSGGYLLSGLGVHMHQLWLLYLGYGVIGGCGLGLGYVSPVSTLIKWFPDRRGLAAGMAIMGFGGGAILAAPLQERLMRAFYVPPTYLGTEAHVHLTTEAGRRYAVVDGVRREAVVVAAHETQQMLVPGPAGAYLVDTGRNGVAATFCTLGVAYLLVMLVAASAYRVPAADWRPAGWDPSQAASRSAKAAPTNDVDADTALRTPQFYLLWLMLCVNVTAGIGVLGVAKTMLTDIFGSALPTIVDGRFAATYVLMISVFNMLGRFFWAGLSDYLGRKRVYAIFFGLGCLLYAMIPSIVAPVAEIEPGLGLFFDGVLSEASTGGAALRGRFMNPGVSFLCLFYVVSMLIFTMYGGGFATIPAYISDLFGTKHVGAIHGRLLTAWSTAGVLGPWALTMLRERSERRALDRLAAVVDPAAFIERFGAPLDELPRLVAAKSVTIAKLLELAPSGTPNPATTLYDSTMYLMAAFLAVGCVANWAVRPLAAATEKPDRESQK